MTFGKSLCALAILAGIAMPSGAFAASRDLKVEEANRKLVVEFYDRFFNSHDIDAASVVADEYRQHNPQVPDGKKPLVSFFTGFFKDNPQSKAKIVRSSADGDLVWLHVHATNGTDDRGQAIVDIFRVKDGKIVEHWDVIQAVPKEAANKNTMF
ncbi:nuclear transport factor 2 family protein [Rhizobium etli]|uniref:Putative SnoaL-like aldol condensation-catalyzing enzyme n=1 Tax=Rhizobium etli TaxID=29449 RepID=A0A7W6ZJ66_RHIET|nr:nuclear transport factor 2 family protein [Rhizobium etli]MBB4481329.1 putative SnoaL-like aldol condensation-catalyzing enzyme [Rhizobium etli]MBB4537058.1 putative SnoaL-like aldol condensation-catalyzing enzyme [Rhizobium etli]